MLALPEPRPKIGRDHPLEGLYRCRVARWRPPAGHTTPPVPVHRRSGRRDGSRADGLSSTPRWPDDARPALQFSAQDILDGGVFQRELGIHPLQIHSLRNEFLRPLELGDARARVLRPPIEIHRAADAVPSHQVRDWDPRLAFLQDANYLTLSEPGLPHGDYFQSGRTSNILWSGSRGILPPDLHRSLRGIAPSM